MFDDISEFLRENWIPLLGTAAGGIAGSSGGSAPPPSGWQGQVSRIPVTRQAIPQAALRAQDPNRRPGAGGRRYFTDTVYQRPPEQAMAAGGIASLTKKPGYYLGGPTDGMADEVPANIDGQREAALSDGEFVIPADVVSHLGNGNSEAGAMQLYKMMERIRRARTGNPEQGRRVNPEQYLPK